jgi:hypothetical protein
VSAQGGRPNALLAGLWLAFAAINAYFGYAMHVLLDWFVAAGCLVVAGMYALRLVRK